LYWSKIRLERLQRKYDALITTGMLDKLKWDPERDAEVVVEVRDELIPECVRMGGELGRYE